MSVSRRELVQYLEQHGYRLVREGANHAIYGKGAVRIPVKRHRTLDRITANEICKQAGLEPRF
jgi:predicted RNA binding protein YcfA (HicA-like mRNA interferase family)